MQLAKDSRRSREAARAISVYLGSARSRAMATRRPCGVVLVSAGTTGDLQNCVMTLQQAEVPPPYAGDTTRPRPRCQAEAARTRRTSPAYSNLSQGWSIKGDMIQFNYEGPWYIVRPIRRKAASR